MGKSLSANHTLNLRQERFCREYIKTGNAAESVRRAGYKVKHAKYASRHGARLMSNESIREYINRLKLKAIRLADLDVETIAQGILAEAVQAKSARDRLTAWKSLADLIHGTKSNIELTTNQAGDDRLIEELTKLGVPESVARSQLGYKTKENGENGGESSSHLHVSPKSLN